MGCGTVLKVVVSTAVALAAVLLYFHLVCVRERQDSLTNKLSGHYRPDKGGHQSRKDIK